MTVSPAKKREPLGLMLWAAGAVTFIIGDLVTTYIGLSQSGVEETGIGPTKLFGTPTITEMVVLKTLVVILFIMLWFITPPKYRLGIPAGIAVVGTIVTVWNTAVIAIAI